MNQIVYEPPGPQATEKKEPMKLVNGQNAVLLSDSEKKELNEILDKVYEFYSAKNPQDSGYFVTWDGAGAFFIQYFDQYLMRNAIPAS